MDDVDDAFLAVKQYFARRLEAGRGGDGGHWLCKCYTLAHVQSDGVDEAPGVCSLSTLE